MKEIVQGDALVQFMGDKPYIYLPKKKCENAGIVKGKSIRLAYRVENLGPDPNPRKPTGFMGDKKQSAERSEATDAGVENEAHSPSASD